MSSHPPPIFTKSIAFGLLVVLSMSFSACTKTPSNGNDGDKFIGRWTGVMAGTLAIVDIAAGGNGNAITTSEILGGTSNCIKPVVINITASGNTILIPAQNYIDACGVTYVITGSGYVDGNTLTLTKNISTSTNTNIAYTFVGTK